MPRASTRPATLRERQADTTRDALVDAAVALIERRAEPTMRAVAAEAGVGERTIYRYFPNRAALAEACATRLAGRAGAPLCDEQSELEDYAGRLFGVFEANAPLIEAMLTNVMTDLAPTRSHNLDAMQALLDRGFPDAPLGERRAAAAVLRTVLSGSGWYYQRRSCGLGPSAVVANAVWMIETVRARLVGTTIRRR